MVEAIIWWVMLEVLGLAALPLAWTVLRRLPDRGYAFAKILGVVLVGYIMWLAAILQLSPFAGPLAWAAVVGVALVSVWLARRNGGVVWAEIRAFFRQRWSYWVTAEVLFTVAFVAMVLIRAYSPNIRITEQYMDFGFLNSIIKNQVMPPPDHWLAGWSINYYYLGYSLMASLTLLSSLPTEIGYNLCMATLFALTALGSFGIVYNLVQGTLSPGRVRTRRTTNAANVPTRRSRRDPQATPGTVTEELADPAADEIGDSAVDPAVDEMDGPAAARPRVLMPPKPAIGALLAGLLAALMIVGMGNLVGAQEVLQQGKTSQNFDYFTLPTRVIHDTDPATGYRDDYGNITEFPLFSFLLNDMHPHVMALPLMLLALALALALLKLGGGAAVGRSRWLPDVGLTWRTTEGRVRLAVTAIVIGMMYGLNTWDYPTYMLIVLACLAWPALAARFDPRPVNEAELEERGTWVRLTAWTGSRVGWWLSQAVVLVVLSLLAYLPFQLTFKSLVGGTTTPIPTNIASIPIFGGLAERIGAFLGINLYDKSYNWDGYIAIFGIFLFAILAFLLLATIRSVFDLRATQNQGTEARTDRLLPLAVVAVLTVIALVLAVSFKFPLLGLLAPMFVFALYLIRERLNPERWQPEEVFVLTLIGLGALITLTTEVVFIKDVFGRRMNTVFKFYYQTWVLWGLSGAYATWWLVGQPLVRTLRARAAQLSGGRTPGRTLADTIGLVTAPLWALGMIVLVGLGLVYTAYGPVAKIQSDYGPPPAGQGFTLRGLDGIAYLRDSAPADFAAIQWLRTNGVPQTAVAEAPGGDYNVYCYCGRVSTMSGLPTVIGWRGHEDQWRGGQADAKAQLDSRVADLDRIYASTDITETRQLMAKYGVRYVFVGTIEKGESAFAENDQRHQYGAGLTKFAQFMAPVYTDGGTTIYMLPEGDNRPSLYQVQAGP